MKERPCYVLPDKDTGAINGLIQATTAIYNDRENRFRNQIAKNHLQSFMLDSYDKCYRCLLYTSSENNSFQTNKKACLLKKQYTPFLSYTNIKFIQFQVLVNIPNAVHLKKPS